MCSEGLRRGLLEALSFLQLPVARAGGTGRTRPGRECLGAVRPMLLPLGKKVVELRGWGAEQGLSVHCFFCCRAEETPVLPRGQGASPTLRGPGAASTDCELSCAQSPSPQRGWSGRSTHLPPSLASLAPAAGPDPGASVIPREARGLYQPPHSTAALFTACFWGAQGEERGVRLGLSREERGAWGAERGLGC